MSVQKMGKVQGGGQREQQVSLQTYPQALGPEYKNKAIIECRLPMN